MPTNAIRIKTNPDFYEPFKIAQAYRVGDLIYVSGQAAVDPQGNLVGVGDFDGQVVQTFENLQRLLELGGSDLSKIVKVVIYVTDMSNFPKVLELREKYFTPPYPADTIVEVSALGLPELEFEIEAIALTDGEMIG